MVIDVILKFHITSGLSVIGALRQAYAIYHTSFVKRCVDENN